MSENRLPNGCFAPGNPGGPGNPLQGSVTKYRQAINEAVSIEDLKDIIRKMVEQAKAGNERAGKVLIERLAGKVVQEVMISGPVKLYDLSKDIEDKV